MSKLRVGIIGTGGIANVHAQCYKEIPEVELVGGADIIPGKAEEFFKRNGIHGAKAFNDHRELLDMGLDAVSVCTYNSTHAECAVNALNAGAHVLLEKPMCINMEQAAAICRAEKKSGKVLTVGFQPRYDANMRMVKEIIGQGTLGKIYYVQTGGGRRRGIPGGTFINKEKAGVGALADIGCYSLDFALNSIGYPKPLTVSAYASNYFGTNPKYFPNAKDFQVDDFSAAFIRLEGDIVLDFRMSWAMHMDFLGDTMFLGTDAGMKVKSPNPEGTWGGAWDGSPGEISIYHDMVVPTKTVLPYKNNEGPSLFMQKVRGFVDAVLGGKPAPIPTSQILYNQAIIDGIIRSSEQKKEVDVIIPEI